MKPDQQRHLADVEGETRRAAALNALMAKLAEIRSGGTVVRLMREEFLLPIGQAIQGCEALV
jgi:hypothetical protein